MHRALHRPAAVLFLLALGAVWPGSTALARNEDGSWEVGAYVLNSSFDNDSTIEDGFGGGVRGAYHFQAKHALEIEIDSVQGENTFTSVDVDVLKYSIGYLHNHFIKGHEKAIPFTTFSVGVVDLDDGTETSTSTLYRLGGGVRYWFTDHVGFRLDARIYRWRGDGTIVPRQGVFSFDMAVGMTFLFGGAQ